MKCNKCETELDEGVVLCPNCGCNNAQAEASAEAVAEETTVEAETVEQAVPEDTQEELNVSEETTDDESAEAQEEQKKSPPVLEIRLTPGKIALLVVLVIAAIAVVVALVIASMGGFARQEATDPTEISGSVEDTVPAEDTVPDETVEVTIPADGNPDDVTCKGSYTVSDQEVIAARDTVVATFGDEELTVGELQVYYWMHLYNFLNSEMGMYISYLGLDYTQPLDTQLSTDGNTWQQYFLAGALDAWHTYTAMGMVAEEAGFQMDATYTDEINAIPSSMEQTATASGFESAQDMLNREMGAGATMDDYMSYVNDYYTFSLYYSEQLQAMEVSDAEAELYFDQNAQTFIDQGYEKGVEHLVDVRHILVMPQGGTTDEYGMTTYSDAEWEACRAKGQKILDEWKAGEATEDSFADLAKEYSEDGNASQGGIYEGVYKGQMVESFENWCFDESRQAGDVDLVQTEYGYHVMYFVKRYEDAEPSWMEAARDEIINTRSDELLSGACDAHEFIVDYSAIVLGFVDMSIE